MTTTAGFEVIASWVGWMCKLLRLWDSKLIGPMLGMYCMYFNVLYHCKCKTARGATEKWRD